MIYFRTSEPWEYFTIFYKNDMNKDEYTNCCYYRYIISNYYFRYIDVYNKQF